MSEQQQGGHHDVVDDLGRVGVVSDLGDGLLVQVPHLMQQLLHQLEPLLHTGWEGVVGGGGGGQVLDPLSVSAATNGTKQNNNNNNTTTITTTKLYERMRW